MRFRIVNCPFLHGQFPKSLENVRKVKFFSREKVVFWYTMICFCSLTVFHLRSFHKLTFTLVKILCYFLFLTLFFHLLVYSNRVIFPIKTRKIRLSSFSYLNLRLFASLFVKKGVNPSFQQGKKNRHKEAKDLILMDLNQDNEIWIFLFPGMRKFSADFPAMSKMHFPAFVMCLHFLHVSIVTPLE